MELFRSDHTAQHPTTPPTYLSPSLTDCLSNKEGESVTATQMIFSSVPPSQLIILQQFDCCQHPLLYTADDRSDL